MLPSSSLSVTLNLALYSPPSWHVSIEFGCSGMIVRSLVAIVSLVEPFVGVGRDTEFAEVGLLGLPFGLCAVGVLTVGGWTGVGDLIGSPKSGLPTWGWGLGRVAEERVAWGWGLGRVAEERVACVLPSVGGWSGRFDLIAVIFACWIAILPCWLGSRPGSVTAMLPGALVVGCGLIAISLRDRAIAVSTSSCSRRCRLDEEAGAG